ncbi:type II secretion system protein [Halarchaeum grantii]|uniref:Type II secretion system protein n=1 Tax=Halarchaeum grantii TaxID=1193105 RepID=A0A830F9R7_9EURY|nr:type II/IV secretion system ATPase subunit [Halarchaeum grantii]GGL32910.1 type II secretion system protein [Halarchaeum grantii]
MVFSLPPLAPPSDPAAWYAPDVRAQYESHPGTVVTVRDDGAGFSYDVREPVLPAADAAARERVEAHFADAHLERPLTREGTVERAAAGLDAKYRRIVDRLAPDAPASRRRLRYYALRDLRCLGDLTAYALDERIEVADAADDHLVVHTTDYAPARTRLPARPAHLGRFLSERLDAYTVPFGEFDVPVVVYREHLLGADPFDLQYAVQEPPLLPGDAELVEACKDAIWETNVDDVVDDRTRFVREYAEGHLSRALSARQTRAWRDALAYRARSALAAYDLAVPPVSRRFSADRLDDLVYYVLRDFVGDGELTVPIRDDRLEDVEANRVGERVKVVPRGGDERVPTNLVFEDETHFVSLVTQLAAHDGVELNAANPSAKVNLRPPEVDADVTIRCAVALPVISEGGPHVSIRKQAPDPLTPVDLVKQGSIPTEAVAMLWMAYERHAAVLFSGPTGAGKTTLMNAHLPFVPFDDRPISIDEGSREVRLPHETGVSLTTRDHENPFKRVTMADLMTETNYLNPDVEVIAEINTPASFETFGEVLNTGHGVIGTTHAEDMETLVNRVVERGLPAYLLREVDLVVFPRHVDGARYVGELVELVRDADAPADGEIVKGETTVRYRRLVARTHDGGFDVRDADSAFFARLAARTDRSVGAVRAEYERKHRYVRYLVEEDVRDADALFAFLADLRVDEAATVERIRGERSARTDGGAR